MEKYVPDIYAKNIYTINYDSLISRGIKCLFFDLDNTIIPVKESHTNLKTIELFKKIKKKDFIIYIVSNSFDRRVGRVAKELDVKYLCYAQKPNTEKVEKLIDQTKKNLSEIAIIGDAITDDILCGNTIGITTILVDPLSHHEYPFAKLRRIKSKFIEKKLRDKDLFIKGRYYE